MRGKWKQWAALGVGALLTLGLLVLSFRVPPRPTPEAPQTASAQVLSAQQETGDDALPEVAQRGNALIWVCSGVCLLASGGLFILAAREMYRGFSRRPPEIL